MPKDKNYNNYKISRYTHIVLVYARTALLYNTQTGALAKVPSQIAEILANGGTESSVPSLLAHDGLRTKLLKGGFVVPCTFDEVANALQTLTKARGASSSVGFTIAPTMACNFACPYCFEPKGTIEMMSRETADALLVFIERLISNKTLLSVTWYGGEPTLAVKRIEYLTKRIDALVNARNIAYYSEIITNGYLLSPEMIERLADCYISRYQITLDGPPEVHDRRRKAKSGDGSFWRIINNISHFMERFRVDIRVNVDRHNVADLDTLVALLDKEGILAHCGLGFAHVDAVTETSSTYRDACIAMPDFAAETLGVYSRNEATLGAPPFPELPHTCGALGPNSYVVDPQGRLYRCWTVIGDASEMIGDIHTPENVAFGDSLRAFDLRSDSECLTCNVLPICLGGCPYKYLKNRDTMDRCSKWKFILPQSIAAYYAATTKNIS